MPTPTSRPTPATAQARTGVTGVCRLATAIGAATANPTIPPTNAQHAASLKAITARQLQARVKQRPAVIQSSVAAAVGTSNQVGGRKRPDNPGAQSNTKPDSPACTETPSSNLTNARASVESLSLQDPL